MSEANAAAKGRRDAARVVETLSAGATGADLAEQLFDHAEQHEVLARLTKGEHRTYHNCMKSDLWAARRKVAPAEVAVVLNPDVRLPDTSGDW